jgi:pyruvate formate lyase activating enzyme
MFSKYFKIIDSNSIQCTACYRACIIKENNTGFCKVRKNIDSRLVTLVYNKISSINIDPIEKKPIFNFLQSTKTLSFGTLGCNFDCAFCQNHEISNCNNKCLELTRQYSPEEIVNLAIEKNCPSISYTYNEPTVFVEFALDTMKLAHKNGLKNIWISNGYMSKEVLKDIVPHLDAINIDLKGTQDFYNALIPGIYVKHIKENIKELYENKIHKDITNLLI